MTTEDQEKYCLSLIEQRVNCKFSGYDVFDLKELAHVSRKLRYKMHKFKELRYVREGSEAEEAKINFEVRFNNDEEMMSLLKRIIYKYEPDLPHPGVIWHGKAWLKLKRHDAKT